jgi:hypothetical protein
VIPRLLLLLTLLCGFAACSTDPEHETFHPRFYCVQETNVRGQLVAEWVAHGYVRRVERGYAFEAIERVTAPPYVQRIRYPEGRKVRIGSPNIVITRCGEPDWHYAMRTKGGRTYK